MNPKPTAVVVARAALVEAAAQIDQKTVASVQDALALVEEVGTSVAALDMNVDGNQLQAVDIGARAATARRETEKLKDATMRPLNDRRNTILGVFKAADEAFATVINAAGLKVQEWRKLEQERQRKAAELDRAHEDARQADIVRTTQLEEARERERLEAAAALETAGRAEEAEAALQEAVAAAPLHSAGEVLAAMSFVPAMAPAAAPEVRGVKIEGGGSATVTDSFDYDVVDPWAIDRAFVKPPEPKRADILKAIKTLVLLKKDLGPDGLPSFPGIKIKRVEGTLFR